MSISAAPVARPAFVPLRLTRQPLSIRIAAVLAATLFLAVCSWISVPLVPVPVTMQTFGVTAIGAAFGWRLGAVAVCAWILEGALGLPVFTGFGAGLAHLTGVTAGYIVTFPFVAALVGWLAERGWTVRLVSGFGVMLLANVLIMAGGSLWLARFIGIAPAVVHGFIPFILGGILKSALAATLVEAARRHLPR